jgi:hypothetical protein
LEHIFGRSATVLLSARGVLHVTALWERQHNAALKNILVASDARPRSSIDTAILMSTRAVADWILTSSCNLRTEGGRTVNSSMPVALPRASQNSPGPRRARRGICFTRYGRIDPSWAFFAATGLQYVPTVATPAESLAECAAHFAKQGQRLPDAIIQVAADPGRTAHVLPSFIRFAQKCHRMPGHTIDGWRFQPAAHRVGEHVLAPRLISIECGPSLTRPLYRSDRSIDGGGRDAATGRCPVDYLLLTTFRGNLTAEAVGVDVVSRNTLDSSFDVLATAVSWDGDTVSQESPNFRRGWSPQLHAISRSAPWTFELLQNKSLRLATASSVSSSCGFRTPEPALPVAFETVSGGSPMQLSASAIFQEPDGV